MGDVSIFSDSGMKKHSLKTTLPDFNIAWVRRRNERAEKTSTDVQGTIR